MTMTISGTDGLTFPDSTAQYSGSYFSFKNRIINGDMRIDQRNAGAAIASPSDNYTVDRWYSRQVGGGVASAQQSTTAPTGFVNSLYLTVTTADSSLASTDRYFISQYIEGLNTADLGWGTANAKSVTLSFWVRSSITGTYGGVFKNSASDRSYPFTYTISSANTWEQKTITVAGDTSGTWLTTTGIGIDVTFGLGLGSAYLGTAGSWAAVNYLSATGSTNWISTLNATFYITGVQLEVGSVATPFERRPYGTELALCQRYYEQVGNATFASFGVGYNWATTGTYAIYYYKTTKRDAATLRTTGTAADYQILHGATSTNCSAVPTLNSANSTTQHAFFETTVASGLTIGQGSILRANNNGAVYLGFSAEL